MNWHLRYTQQAGWTGALRSYLFDRAGLGAAQAVLEVGCGTGAVLSEVSKVPWRHGLDIDRTALIEASLHAPGTFLVHGNALALPYPDHFFDIVYCHFLLLWVQDPLRALQEMKRVTRKNGSVIAFAEPNYLARLDEPQELIPLGRWQTDSLRRQGADPGLGARLAELFFEAGIGPLETGIMESGADESSPQDWEIEWAVLESDLKGQVPDREIRRMKQLDQQAREQGRRRLHVPTYFAWGRV